MLWKRRVRYGSEDVKSFENWLKRVNVFREAIEFRRKKRDGIRLGRLLKQ